MRGQCVQSRDEANRRRPATNAAIDANSPKLSVNPVPSPVVVDDCCVGVISVGRGSRGCDDCGGVVVVRVTVLVGSCLSVVPLRLIAVRTVSLTRLSVCTVTRPERFTVLVEILDGNTSPTVTVVDSPGFN
jgi:hypothetical protein